MFPIHLCLANPRNAQYVPAERTESVAGDCRGGEAYRALLQVLEWSSPSVNVVEQPEHIDFNVVLDSGAAEHVVNSSDTPGYTVVPGPGSQAGGCFIAANGEPIPNKGEVTLQLEGTGGAQINSKFQVAAISRPLWSVGRMCDAGYTVVFDAGQAAVYHIETGEEVVVFPRKNGLYTADLKLKNPAYKRAAANPAKVANTGVRKSGFRRQE